MKTKWVSPLASAQFTLGDSRDRRKARDILESITPRGLKYDFWVGGDAQILTIIASTAGGVEELAAFTESWDNWLD